MATARRDLFALADGITNRRAVGYARYSSEMQKDGWTIQAQTKTIIDHLQSKGIPLVASTKDEAKSGKTLAREGLQEALGYIERGEANLLVVAKLDRATRDVFDAFGLERKLRALAAGLYCIEENIDTSNPQAFVQFAMHAVMADHYRKNLAGETAKGKRARVAAGLPNGDPPYGYRRAVATDLPDFNGDAEALLKALRLHPYIAVPEHAEAVRLAFTLYAAGTHSDTQITAELNRRGYRMVSKWQPAGGPFKRDTITAMLTDPFYCGRVSYAGLKMHGKLDLKLRRRHGRAEYKEGKHEAIIDPKLFDAVQALRASRRRVGPARQPNATTGRVFLASRLVRCSVCGERLRANAGRGKPIYRDCSPERGIACSAHRRRIDAAIVHAAISAFIAAIRLPDDWRARAFAAAARDETSLHRQERRTALERKRARLKDLVKEGIIDTTEYRADVAAIDTELATLAHETEEADLAAIAARLENLSVLWADATEEERLQIAAGLIDAVWVDLDGKKVLGIQPADEYHRLGMALPAVWSFCGTDGIRTRDLVRDKQAHWATTPWHAAVQEGIVAYLICSFPRQALAQPHPTGRIYRPEPTIVEPGIDTLIGGALALGAWAVWPAWGARRRPPSSPICSVSSAPHLLPLWQASLSFVLLPQIVRARSALMRPESTRNGQRYDGAVDRSDGTTAQKDSGR